MKVNDYKKILIVLLLLTILGGGVPVWAAPDGGVEPLPTSVIVQYKGQAEPVVIPLKKGESAASRIKRLQKDPRVIYAEPNYVYQAAALTPSDLHFSDQWYLKRIKAPEGWGIQAQSPNIVVAVIDSGVDTHHPDLRANLWVNPAEVDGNKKDDDQNGYIDDHYGWDFVNNVADPGPKFKTGYTEAGILHGTIVAGVLGAVGDNIEGISGVTWKTKIMSLKALDDAGNGETSRVVKAIDYAVAKGANIINLSFVGYASSRTMRDAIQRAVDAGVIVVAPAGNEQSAGHGVNLNTKPIYPACYKNDANQSLVIGVAATDGIDQKAPFSGYGNSCVDISAPGVGFFSTAVYAPQQTWHGKFFDNYYDGYWSGTSVAVPLVSGALALIQSANPTLTVQQSTNILLQSSDNIEALNPDYAGQLGRGRLNVENALTAATQPLRQRTAYMAVTPAGHAEPVVTLMNTQGSEISSFLAYDRRFRGGVNLVAADLTGDGRDEIITAPASQLESDIKIFSSEGKFLRHFLAYPSTYRGGVNIAVADLNQDGKYEIITAPASGRKAEIKVFTSEGKLLTTFLAYPATFTGGAVVAAGNVMGDAQAEIVVGTGKGGIPEVKVFSSAGQRLSSFVVGNRTAATGLRLSVLDIDANPRRQTAEIVVTRQGSSPEGVIVDFKGTVRRRFQVYLPSFKGDITTMTADVNQDGLKEIVSFPGVGGGPQIKFFTHLGDFKYSFYAYPFDFKGGVNATVFYSKL